MAEICIVTDNTVQFTRPNFVGCERVHVVPFRVRSGPEGEEVIPPQVEDFVNIYTHLGKQYDVALVITLSSFFYPLARVAQQAVQQCGGNHLTVQAVDSQNISLGLGMLVQLAAAAASAGESLTAVERLVRQTVHNIYMLFCIPTLERIVRYGCLTRAQAVVGEILGWLPLLALEEGRLIPLQKVRVARYLLEALQEYLSEFADPERIGFLYSQQHQTCYTRPIREFARMMFPRAGFGEHKLESVVTALLGEQTLALTVMERGENGGVSARVKGENRYT